MEMITLFSKTTEWRLGNLEVRVEQGFEDFGEGSRVDRGAFAHERAQTGVSESGLSLTVPQTS